MDHILNHGFSIETLVEEPYEGPRHPSIKHPERGMGGGNILEDERDRIALYAYIQPGFALAQM
jgi:hypothetical protein